MCGIFGYVGPKDAGSIVLEGLKKLEYRGYDSCGIGTYNEGKLHIRKGAGKIDEVEKKHQLGDIPGTTAIGHNRWATTGIVNDQNAHPHTDCRQQIAVVHNGIIENYQELKKELQTQGHRFISQTDSEVIAHAIEAQEGTLSEKVRAAALQLQGSFALLVINTHDPHILVAVRNESPLVIGSTYAESAENAVELFAASDTTAFLHQTHWAHYMQNGEMAILERGKNPVFLDVKSGKTIQKERTKITWSAEQATKEGYPHFMIKEILEQPGVIKNALAQDPEKLNQFVQLFKTHSDIKFVACGTSRHAALVGRYAINQLAGKSAETYIASEFSYFADQCTKDTLIIAVSQSGETADVLVGLRKAKSKGAKIASIVNVAGSSIDRESDVTLYLNCGPEVAVASTKAFTAQLTILYLLAYALAGQKNTGIQHLKNAARHAADLLPQWQKQSQQLAQSWTQREHVYFLGRGVNFPIALEGALKLKEISYIHAEGMPAGELKHGTLALIEKNTPVVLINPHDYTFADTLSNGMETKARGAKLIGLSDAPNEAYDTHIALPKVSELFYPLVAILPLQLLAYHAAVLRQHDPDRPRNLAKAVTCK